MLKKEKLAVDAVVQQGSTTLTLLPPVSHCFNIQEPVAKKKNEEENIFF